MYSNINIPSATISATTSTARTAYPVSGSPLKNTVFVYNAGSVPVFVTSGDSTVVATVAGSIVPPAQTRLFSKAVGDTHMAAITASSTATVYFQEADSGNF